MTEEQQKERFSQAYVRAVAAAARVNLYCPEVDDDSVDLGFAARIARERVQRPRLEAQLKCSAVVPGNATHYRYPLNLKNYDDLRGDDVIPRILILLVVPRKIEDWLRQTGDELLMRKCAHWLDLRGLPDTENTAKVTVLVPKAQIFDVAALQQWLAMEATS